MGPEGLYGHFGFDVIWGEEWLRWAQLWFGTHMTLRASGLPPLAPFGLIVLGQKGLDWPPRHLGCGTPNEKGWLWLGGPEPPGRQKDTPRPKNKDRGLGVGDMGIGQEGQ
ncbi:hypothetical protein O181_121675 [Austropuccinia psidii MF-1]|uniref:Uncharacterized protein n=1 Tax=Austropuccinia psidii MF-1 TaxID=1389203 RepID=A0A9Q3Q2J3_9BASI|nr:hypothetical protein [Austropuccinia psidii MF-1]